MTASDKQEAVKLIDQLLELAQGTRIREVQAMGEAKWDKHYREAAQEDWNEFNQKHEMLYRLIRCQ